MLLYMFFPRTCTACFFSHDDMSQVIKRFDGAELYGRTVSASQATTS